MKVQGQKPEKVVEGELLDGEGYATYAKVGGKWYSINGDYGRVEDVRWTVDDPAKVKVLEDQSN